MPIQIAAFDICKMLLAPHGFNVHAGSEGACQWLCEPCGQAAQSRPRLAQPGFWLGIPSPQLTLYMQVGSMLTEKGSKSGPEFDAALSGAAAGAAAATRSGAVPGAATNTGKLGDVIWQGLVKVRRGHAVKSLRTSFGKDPAPIMPWCLLQALDALHGAGVAVWHLERVLIKKRDPLSHKFLADTLAAAGVSPPLLTFW